MEKIGSVEQTLKIINENDFYIKKKFGQNFIIDQNVLNAIVDASLIDKDTCVVEIGPGLGSLTEILIKRAKKVMSFEIDKDLIPILNHNLGQYDNFILVNEDILNIDINAYLDKYFSDSKKIALVANLPYYITTQIIEKVLTESKVIDEIVVMVQKEVALKYTSDYKSPLMYMIEDMGKIEYMFTVSQNVFIPAPHIDSAILKITINKEANLDLYKVLNSAFKQRRKTIYNNLKQEYQNALDVLNENQIDQKLRCEQLTLEDYQVITKSLYKHTI